MDPFIGQIQAFAFDWAPRGWLPCDGRLLPIADYQALFSLLGTTYGGDGRTTFGIPDLRDQVEQGRKSRGKAGRPSTQHELSYCIAVQGLFPARP